MVSVLMRDIPSSSCAGEYEDPRMHSRIFSEKEAKEGILTP
jgi:hypothetical protein